MLQTAGKINVRARRKPLVKGGRRAEGARGDFFHLSANDVHYTQAPGFFSQREAQVKPSTLLRIASVLSLIFCAGHTYGSLFAPIREPADAAVFMAMQSYRFRILGAVRTHWEFYRGYSILFSVTLLLLAVMLWQLAALAKTDAVRMRPLLVSLFLGYLAFTVVSGKYFFIAPAAFSAAVAICLALAIMSARKTQP